MGTSNDSTRGAPSPGMVTAGWILLGLMLTVTLLLAGAMAIALIDQPEQGGWSIGLALTAVAGVAWLMALVVLYLPGIALLVVGRSRARGPVRFQGLALGYAMAGVPLVVVITVVASAIVDSLETPDGVPWAIGATLLALLLLVPIAAAWAIWGKRRG